MKTPTRFKVPVTALIHIGLSLLLGFLWFIVLYGRFPLYFTHVNWIYNTGGDVLQHQLGWEWFRNESWQFPLGKITAYGYPFGTSVVFMDAIPLFAIPLKLISPWFKSNFQYFGAWELFSITGQMLAGMLILHEFTRSYPLKILGASLLVLSPPMIFRAFYHSSLSAHWILLFAIWFIILEYRRQLWRGAWAVLFGLAVLIHVYFIPMLIPLWLLGLFVRYKRPPTPAQPDVDRPDGAGNASVHHPSREGKRMLILIDIGSVMLVVVLVGLSIGLFGLSFNSLTKTGFGIYSWNLNGFFNPFNFSSAYLKEMETGTAGQYEGFSYLGLGNILVLPVALYIFLEKGLWRRQKALLLPVGAAALVYILFALSNRAYFNTLTLWDIPLPEAVLNIFNLFPAAGRFIWPVFYFLVLFGIIVLIRNLRFPVPVLLLMLLLQFSDLQPLYLSKKLTEVEVFQNNLQAELWKSAAETNQHVVLLPAKRLRPPYETLALYAVRNRLTLNTGYFARSDMRAFEAHGEKVWEDLKANRSDSQTLYILMDPEWIADARASLAASMFTCEVDGLTILFSPENQLAKSQSVLSAYCSPPERKE